MFTKIFQRPKVEEKRPHQFLQKRHSSVVAAAATSESGLPSIDLDGLSETERPMYESWWRDLDPFNLEHMNNRTILQFLNGCSLEHGKLEQILTLFESAKDGLTKFQFFAMLRLIAHAQNGRKISRALIYLGAPIPHFHTNAIDALFVVSERKSWWGQQIENPQTYCYELFEDKHNSHSRSRSAGTASELFQPINPYYHQPQELRSSRSSLSLHDLTASKPLLLTQKFVYQSPSIRNKELLPNNTNNPFQINHTTEELDPFDDENSSDDVDSPVLINQKPNSNHIPPPPVPSQFTKPAFPKYTRTNTFLLHRRP